MRIYLIFFLILYISGTTAYGQDHESNLVRMMDSLLLNSQFAEAIALLEQRSGEAPSILLQNKKAEALTRNGNFEAAESLLNSIESQASLQRDAYMQAVTKSNHGFLQLNLGRNDLAEQSLLQAIRKFEDAGKGNTAEVAQAFSNLGLVYMSQGKYSQAQEQLHRALSLRQAGAKNTDELIAATYNDLGLVYSQTDKERALGYLEQAQKMYVALYGERHPKIAIANINTGIVYRDLELFGDAVNNFETALKISNAVYAKPEPLKAIALYNLGQTYLKLRDRKTAMAYYDQARKMYEDCYGPQHPEVASVLNAIGNLQLAEGQYTKALHTYQASLHANAPGFTAQDLHLNPPLKNFYHGTRLLHTLMFKAQAFEAKYFGKSLKFSDLSDALEVLTRCDSLIDQLRQQSTNENDKLLLGAMSNEVYADGVRIAYEAGLNAVSKEAYFRQAFYFAEKSKGAVLLESISESNAKSFAGIPNELLEEEKNLKSALTLVAQKLAEKPTAEEEKLLRENSFLLKRKYDAFIHKLEQQFPAYFNLKFNSSAPSIAELQGLLDDKTALLSYFIDEKNNQLYIYFISRTAYKVIQRTWSNDFEKYLTGLRNGLYFDEIRTFKESAFALGRELIPSIPSSITQLVIIPTGRLSLIPFETLLTRDAQKINDYRSMPYLMKRFIIRYEFSAGLILQKSGKRKPQASPSIFLCAPVSFTGKGYLMNLPGTEQEVSEISKLFKERNLISASYIRLQADENQIKKGNLNEYDFLHFATHGIVDESSPELSRIFLQPYGNTEDGNLFAGEIYNLELNADLVTLSACETGLGKIQKGEGVIGLSRALAYAGASHILVSFWNVADESTALLMKDFYSNILEHQDRHYSNGLRQAKLNLINTTQYSAPFYWAPFVFLGF
ncbi:MAG TPA: CHAT domain-containing tetratricopeptide repeat protein [Chryseosolibacter sp.]|nr:CHAT domain-containing tetratricopeptide repeat protein [Chryseosolibacter sp.]